MNFRHLAAWMDLLPYRRTPWLRSFAGRGRVALDVGGGTGRVGRRLRNDFERVIILDAERSMLVRAHRRGMDVVIADAAALPVKAGAADLALAVDALHHFPRQEDALREMRRVLAARGSLVVEEFDPSSLRGRLIELGERALRFGSTFHPPERLLAMTRAAGFDARIVRHSAWEYAIAAPSAQESKD